MGGQNVVLMWFLALTTCIVPAITTEECHVVQLPDGLTFLPLQHQRIREDEEEEVLEVEVLLHPSIPSWRSAFKSTEVALELTTLDNYTFVASVHLLRGTSMGHGDLIKENLVLECHTRGWDKVISPWDESNATKTNTTLSVTLQMGLTWLRVYQQLAGRDRMAGQTRCPGGIPGFPPYEIEVECLVGNKCGELTSFNQEGSHTRKVKRWPKLSVDVEPTTIEGVEVVEAKFHFTSLPQNHSWAIRLTPIADLENTRTLIELRYTPGWFVGNYSLDMVCDPSNDYIDVVQPFLTKNTPTRPPTRSIIVQAGRQWLKVLETTGGQRRLIQEYNCSTPMAAFPHLNMTVRCIEDNCGWVSYPCRKDFEEVQQVQILWIPNLGKTVMKLLVVVVVLAVALGEALAWVWRRYLDIHLGHHLAPLCRCPPLSCRTPPASTTPSPPPSPQFLGPPTIPMPSSVLPPTLPLRPPPQLVVVQVHHTSSTSTDSHHYSDPDDTDSSYSYSDGSYTDDPGSEDFNV